MRKHPGSPSRHSWTATAGAYFPFLLFFLFWIGAKLGGVFWLLPASFVMCVVPVLDVISGEDLVSLTSGDFSGVQRRILELAPILFVCGQTVVVLWTLVHFNHLTGTERILSIFSVGVIGSIGITAAHELVHKTGIVSKTWGRLGLLNVAYLHFEIHHIRGHHVHFGTEKDASTAWKGESLYGFVWRTIPGCLRSAWELEAVRLRRHTQGTLSAHNQLIWFSGLQLVSFGGLFVFTGMPGLVCFVAQAVIAVFMLEAVSYIKHYGLKRSTGSNVRSVPAIHSWDAYYRFSNYLEFQLQRHTDHHLAPRKGHGELLVHATSPRLPAGYSAMILLAMIPPLWRRVMDPLLPGNSACAPSKAILEAV